MEEKISLGDWNSWKRKRMETKDLYCLEKSCRGVTYCVESRTDTCCVKCYEREQDEKQL